MKLIQLIFKKVGNHWYLDIPHDDPKDLILDRRIERFIEHLDYDQSGVMNRICLIEQGDFIDHDGLIQFSDRDLLRYFTTNDKFNMTVSINHHRFKISSNLYTLLENKFKADFHVSAYKIIIY